MFTSQYKLSSNGKFVIGKIVVEETDHCILEITNTDVDQYAVGTRIKFSFFYPTTSAAEIMKFHSWDPYIDPTYIDPAGQTCEKCKLYFSYVAPNTVNQTYICYDCRQ